MGDAQRQVPTVCVGPFAVADVTYEDAIVRMADLAERNAGPPATAFALHVGGLAARNQPDFVEAMTAADLVYADGASVTVIARAAGATVMERTPTTDAGWSVLREIGRRQGASPIVSIVGGPEGLAGRALAALVEGGSARPGAVEHGYHDDWGPVLERLRHTPCDVLIVGLGAPREMLWVEHHRAQLPGRLVLTCGGWLGFLAGEESRAPRLLQKLSLEWAYRLAQSPRRLFTRYARGALVTARLTIQARRQRAKITA